MSSQNKNKTAASRPRTRSTTSVPPADEPPTGNGDATTASGAQNGPEIEDGDTGPGGMERGAGTATLVGGPPGSISDAHSRTRGHVPSTASLNSGKANSGRAPTARSEASVASGTSRRAPPSEADVERDVLDDEPARGDVDVSEQLYSRLAHQFGGRINTLFDEFESITNILNDDRAVQKEERKLQAAAERRREEKFRAALQAQQEAMATLAVELHDRLHGIRKGKFVVRLPDGSEAVDMDGLQLPQISVVAPRPPPEAQVPPSGGAPDPKARTARQVTIEEVADRDAPPHLDPSHALDSDSRLRRANLLPTANDSRRGQPIAIAARAAADSASRAHPARRTEVEYIEVDSDDGPQQAAHAKPPRLGMPHPRGLGLGGPTRNAVSPDSTMAPQVIMSAYGGPLATATPSGRVRNSALPTDPYLEMNLQKIRDQVDRMVGRQRAGAPPKSAAKPTAPTAYDGKNDHELFYTWLCGITTYLRLSYLCGEEYDEDRLLHAVNCLTGEAQEWWQEEVLNAVFHGRRDWTFRDAVCAMYTRFVRKGSSQTAARQFRRTKYSRSKGGANAFYNRILKYAGRMIVYPDDYTLSSKFYDGIPPAMSSALTKIYQLTPESCDIGSLLYHALIIEDNDEYLEHRERDLDSARTAPSGSSRSATSRPVTTTSTPRDARPADTGWPSSRTVPVPKPRPTAFAGGSASAAPRRPEQSSRGPRREGTRGQCYSCKSTGHYANDPACPMYVKPALRRISEDADVDQNTAPLDTDTPIATSTTAPDEDVLLMTMHSDGASDDESLAASYADGSQYEPSGSEYADSEDADQQTSDDECYRAMRLVDDDIPALAPIPRHTTRSAQRAEADALALARALEDPELPALGDAAIADDTAPADSDDDMPSLDTVSDSDDDQSTWDPVHDSDDDDDVDPVVPGIPPSTASDDSARGPSPATEPDADAAFAALFGHAIFEPIHGSAHADPGTDGSPSVPDHDGQQQLDALRHLLHDREERLARRAEHVLSLQRDIQTLRSAIAHDISATAVHRLLANIAQRDLHFTLRDGGSPGLPGYVPTSEADDALVAHLIQQQYHISPALERLSAIAAPTASRVYRTAMRTTGSAQQRPSTASRCFSVYVEIGGLRALALIDTGSTINCVSPEFARVSRIPVFELSNPVGLQLGCVGSRSRINFGARTAIQLAHRTDPTYLDVVNIDHYDVILGIPYMKAVGLVLDFGTDCLRLGSTSVPVLRGEGSTYAERQAHAQSAAPQRQGRTSQDTAPPRPAPAPRN